MPSNTAKWLIPYPVPTDPVASEAATLLNTVTKLDQLLGEYGSLSVSPAANTTGSSAIVLSRTYPGGTGLAVPGIVIVNLSATLSAATGFTWWVNGWTGTAATITGFTLNYQFTAAQASRGLQWRFLPSST